MKIEEILELQLERLKAIIIEGRQKSLTNQEKIPLKTFYTNIAFNGKFSIELRNYFNAGDSLELQNYCLAQWISMLQDSQNLRTIEAKIMIEEIIFFWKNNIVEDYKNNAIYLDSEVMTSLNEDVSNITKELNLEEKDLEKKLTKEERYEILYEIQSRILKNIADLVKSNDEKIMEKSALLISKIEAIEILIMHHVFYRLSSKESFLNSMKSKMNQNSHFKNESQEKFPLTYHAVDLAEMDATIKLKEFFTNLKISQQSLPNKAASLIDFVKNLRATYRVSNTNLKTLNKQYNDYIENQLNLYEDLHNKIKTKNLNSIQELTKINAVQKCDLITSELENFTTFLKDDLRHMMEAIKELNEYLEEIVELKDLMSTTNQKIGDIKKASKDLKQSFLNDAKEEGITVILKSSKDPNSSLVKKFYEATINDNTKLNAKIDDIITQHAECRAILKAKRSELVTQLMQESKLFIQQQQEISAKEQKFAKTKYNNGIVKALLAVALIVVVGAFTGFGVTLGLKLSATAIIPLAVPIALAVVAAIGAVTAIGSGVGLYKSDKQVKIQQAELEMPEQSVLNGPTVAALDHKQNTVMAK